MWLVCVRWKKQTNPRRVACEAYGYAARHSPPKWRGVWLYNLPPATASQISSKEATKRAVHSTARNSTRSHISGNRGYESNKVRSLSIFHSYCKYGNQFNHAVLWRGTTRNQDSHGIRPRGVNRVHQAHSEPWGSPSGPGVSSRQWYPGIHTVMYRPSKEGLEQCWSSEPEKIAI